MLRLGRLSHVARAHRQLGRPSPVAGRTPELPILRSRLSPSLNRRQLGIQVFQRLIHTSPARWAEQKQEKEQQSAEQPDESRPAWARKLGLFREDGSDNLPRILGVSALAFLISFGVATGIRLLFMLRKEDKINQLLVIVGTHSDEEGRGGDLRTLVYDTADSAFADFQSVPHAADAGWVTLSPDGRFVLVLETSLQPGGAGGEEGDGGKPTNGKKESSPRGNRLCALEITEDGSLDLKSSLELPPGTWGPGAVEYVGDLPTHFLAVVTNYETGRIHVLRQSFEGGLELTQSLVSPHNENLAPNPCRAFVAPPFIAIPDAGTGVVSLFRLQDAQSIDLAAVAPIAEPGTLRLSGMEFCPKTRSAVFLQDEDGLRSLPWPEGDLEGWEGFPEGIAGTVGAEQEFRYQHVRRDPYLHHLLGLQSRRVKGDEHRGAHLVLQKCPPDVNPGFALVSDDAADSITTVSLDRKTGELLPQRKISTWSGGVSPGHMSLSPDGRTLFVVNQGSGELAAFRVGPTGSLALQEILKIPGATHVQSVELKTVAPFVVERDEYSRHLL